MMSDAPENPVKGDACPRHWKEDWLMPSLRARKAGQKNLAGPH